MKTATVTIERRDFNALAPEERATIIKEIGQPRTSSPDALVYEMSIEHLHKTMDSIITRLDMSTYKVEAL